MAKIPVTNEIKMFFHCRRCISELPDGMAPREWVRLEAGWTRQGFQVWCIRHEINIIHMDFEGAQHPANTTRLAD